MWTFTKSARIPLQNTRSQLWHRLPGEKMASLREIDKHKEAVARLLHVPSATWFWFCSYGSMKWFFPLGHWWSEWEGLNLSGWVLVSTSGLPNEASVFWDRGTGGLHRKDCLFLHHEKAVWELWNTTKRWDTVFPPHWCYTHTRIQTHTAAVNWWKGLHACTHTK